MATAQLAGIRKIFERVRDSAASGDGELLTRYRTLRDQDAFGSIVRRHAPMVLGVCRRVLRDHHAADDAFQATFLVLARKADAVRPPDRLGPWLYGVAYRTALKARGRAFRRRQVEQDYATTATRTARRDEYDDLAPLIDEQLNALPEKYRTPLVLCAVQGLNKEQAARRLGLPEGTVSSRLARAREMLRDRLSRRGVVVPATAIAALLTADTLQAAAPAALVACAVRLSAPSAISPTVLTLSHEVIRSMTLLKLKFLGAIAMAVSLAGGGFGVVALQADEKKPAPQAGKPAKPVADKPNADKPKPEKPSPDKPKPVAPEGQKPVKPDKPAMRGGKVASVDAKENTVMLALKGDGGIVEKAVQLAPGAKVFIDGKEAKLADVPKDSNALYIPGKSKEGELPVATELRISGSNVNGVVKEATATSITLTSEKAGDRTFPLAAGGKVTVDGKDAKLADVKTGSPAIVTLTADEKSALSVVSGVKANIEKPGNKPLRFGGKIASVDAGARTVHVAGKGESGKEITVKITDDAKITVDGKPAKLADLQKGANVTFNISSAKYGQPREANEVIVAGATFGGTIKQIDQSSLTIGNEKADRVFKLATVGKVVINDKEAKIGDLKVGDRVNATLTSDETGVTVITVGGKKVKPDKEENEDNDQ